MIEHKFSEENLRRYVKSQVHLEVSSEGMEPTKFKRLDNAAAFIGVLKQTLISIRDLSSPGKKVEPKYSLLNGLTLHSAYSQLDKY